ncbi:MULTISPECIES: 1-phosphofructokinase [Brevibacillus]|jgi:1-phosphofructokinase|uniref:Tagatose-6-phosphate kinase n=1 Tax=Brevibacillus borstelensis AK1 TaxID=1300222 RepID=M8DCD2_9BACL|nr:1-phosphofructokinase [Brevibacillus borstelensis]EMT51073.1 fructose 1-phosphate kinase [Brevibacillus borstelensis AK1]MBE5395838.1 1-phosphofructokinase [Brevibacillus borstelensis]MCM3472675.1 1-phosphofructokinase [Brevibacillus borstelensis]MCM3560543.1 1-phosphofructokinase [Brevibacillus borstelensis]MCM3624167.1 1-phosphofructokinase [Brevibacillus borstelensis]
MIYTVTLNPSIDYHVWIDSWEEGQIHKAQKDRKVAGGKGINVSKVLRNLEMDSTALGFVGGFAGAFIADQLERDGIRHELIKIEQESRLNIKIKAHVETDISGVPPEIPAEALAKLHGRLDQLTDEDCLVLAGSVPRGVPNDIYQAIMKRLVPKGVRIFLDASGKALADGLAERPFLIKPNHHELGELFGVNILSPADAIFYGKKALEAGARNVIVSMAEQGAVFVNSKAAFAARIPKQDPVNSIGAGDSVVAGFLYAYEKGMELEDAFRFAVAAGSATALSEGFCTHEKIKAFSPKITISRVE